MENETETGLEKIVQDSGLNLSESEQIKQSYLPYFAQIAEIKLEAKKIDFENPTATDEMIARKLRLRTVRIRTGSELVKDERKKGYILRGNLEQAAWNLIKSGCLLEEDIFLQVEKKREIAQAKKEKELFDCRLVTLSEYVDNANIYPLGNMEEAAFTDLVNGFKLQREAKERAEKEAALKAEQERAAEAKRIEEQRLENERLKREAKEKEAAEKLIRDKKDAELKKEREAAERAETERNAKEAAEKKAAKAPDKTKLKSIDLLAISFEVPALKTKEAQDVADLITAKFEGFKTWANNLIETL